MGGADAAAAAAAAAAAVAENAELVGEFAVAFLQQLSPLSLRQPATGHFRHHSRVVVVVAAAAAAAAAVVGFEL